MPGVSLRFHCAVLALLLLVGAAERVVVDHIRSAFVDRPEPDLILSANGLPLA
jgi:hypothetical protein